MWFAADGGPVVRTATWGDYLMSWLYELHMHLLAGDLGSQIVGWSGFVLLVLLISGVATWWPRGSWRKALAIKRNAVPQRRPAPVVPEGEPDGLREALAGIDPDEMTPRAALEALYRLKGIA